MGETTWSYTKGSTLRQCNRKFFFAYRLQSWGRKDLLRRKAYELGHMKNLDMWVGSVVDKIMNEKIIPSIVAKEVLDFPALADYAISIAQKQFNYSSNKIYRLPKNKQATITEEDNEPCILDIHETSKEYNPEDIAQSYEKIRTAILSIPDIFMPDGKTTLLNYLYASYPLLPDLKAWSFYVEAVRVNPQIDLVGYHAFKPFVIDWKVSESLSSDYSKQLLVCGLAVYYKRLEKERKEGKAPYEFNDIRLFKVNLLKKEVTEYAMDPDKINEIIDSINLSGRDIKLLEAMTEPDVAEMPSIAATENEANCLFCNYKTLCTYLYLNNHEYDEKNYLQSIQIAEPAGA